MNAEPQEPESTVANVRPNPRNLSLIVIAFVVTLFALKFSKPVVIPIALSVGLGYALMPVVDGLRRYLRLPLPLGAGLVLGLLITAILYGVSALEPQALKMLDELPAATHNLERMLRKTSLDKTSAIQKLTAAANAIEAATQGGALSGDSASKLQQATLPSLREYLWTGTSAAAEAVGQSVIVLALSYFLLISDHAFKRKLMRITGNSLHQRKITVKILAEIDEQIQRYLLIQLLLSVVVGLLTGIFLAIVGLDNALFWGVTAGLLHFIPYIGPTFAIFATSAFAFLQFDSLSSVLVVAGGSLLIVGVIGLGVLPWITGRTARISAISTFIGLLVWDWLWGVPGLLLGIPIMMAVMAVCERIEGLRPIAELMNRD